MIWGIIILLSITILFCVYIVYRLNLYIEQLEKQVKDNITLTENLKQSLKDIIIENALENDGRLKKFRIQKERNVIFNGNKVDENDYEL
jgi:cell division protein FtsL